MVERESEIVEVWSAPRRPFTFGEALEVAIFNSGEGSARSVSLCEELSDRFRERLKLELIKDNPEAGSSRAGEDLKQVGPGELWPKHCSAERPSNIGSGLEDLINHSRS